MTEDAPPIYIVRDFCASCGERLVQLEHGGRAACHPDDAMYWSEAEPLPADVRGSIKLTGYMPRVQTEWYDLRTGIRITHAPLFLYRRAA